MISAGGRQKLPHQEIQNDVCSIDAGNQAWMSDGRKRYSVGFGQSDAPPDGLVSRGMGPIRKHSLRCSIPLYRWRQTNSVYDYQANIASYPEWQAWLREHRPPTLVIWGRNDPSFIVPGAEAFKRDLSGCRDPSARRRSFRAGREER